MDWLNKVTEAEEIDQRQVEGRDSVRIQTDLGVFTVEKYYGFLFGIINGKDVWEFRDAKFNSVKDSDVNP